MNLFDFADLILIPHDVYNDSRIFMANSSRNKRRNSNFSRLNLDIDSFNDDDEVDNRWNNCFKRIISSLCIAKFKYVLAEVNNPKFRSIHIWCICFFP